MQTKQKISACQYSTGFLQPLHLTFLQRVFCSPNNSSRLDPPISNSKRIKIKAPVIY